MDLIHKNLGMDSKAKNRCYFEAIVKTSTYFYVSVSTRSVVLNPIIREIQSRAFIYNEFIESITWSSLHWTIKWLKHVA